MATERVRVAFFGYRRQRYYAGVKQTTLQLEPVLARP